MVCVRILQLFGLACLAPVLHAGHDNHLVTAPQSQVLEIGTNFTATCTIINTAVVTADDLYWNLTKTVVPREFYTKINASVLNVTVPIIGERSEWLFCFSKKNSPYVDLNKSKFIHGTWLKKGYRPERPEKLFCVVLQEGPDISSKFSCQWEAVGRQTADVPTNYTLVVKETLPNYMYSASTYHNSAQVLMKSFPSHMSLEVWVEAHNLLGTVESEHLIQDANYFVKTNPPSDVQIISEESFPTSLLTNWRSPIASVIIKLTYQIRFCPQGSQNWSYVPLADTEKHTNSFRLQNLQPDTVYVIQVCCKNFRRDSGYWSNWSRNATMRTPEDRPSSKPGLWRTIVDDGINGQEVQLICKDPDVVNGRLTAFVMRIQNNKKENWEQENIPVNRSKADSRPDQVTSLKTIPLAERSSVKVCVAAVNSVGTSPEACLVISSKPSEHVVEEIRVWPEGGQLFVEWKPPVGRAVEEYVIEWVSDDKINWQRENKTTTRAAIKGHLQRFVCYKVSVYPIYSIWVGKPASKEVYLEQGAPLQGPSIKKSSPGYDHAELVWDQISLLQRRGFITNYTIFYRCEKETHAITVPANSTSHTLKSLLGNTKYDVWISASTSRGSANGSSHSFTTLKYAPGMMEGIVVGVSFGFLFLALVAILLCIYKRDVIKENFWPQIPNPRESTIGNWSPDNPLKPETPKENCLSGVCVLDEGVCDVKNGFEEDKTSLSLRKDKYLSEEHSSGIGGSSCMSSPRHSVSDSDEGADVADTTASTVQYSSIVAYKGQTPSSQLQHSIFSRSDSTQPLLESEENPDVSVVDGSRQRFPRQSCSSDVTDPNSFKQLEMEQQAFCPIREDTEWTAASDVQSADAEPASMSSYMPQRGGYRPQ